MEFNHPCPKSLPDTSPCSSRPIRYLFTLCAFLASCNEQVDDLVRESDIGKWKYYTRSHGLASDYINTIFEDSNGNVWIGTDQGISVYRAGDFDHYSGADGLISNSVFAITE